MTGTSVTFDIIGRDRSGSAAFNKVANSADRADGAMSKFSAGAMKVVRAGAVAGAAAGGLAVKLGIDAVGAASDLNETLSKSAVIFGKHAADMEAWAGRADSSMGLSQQAALAAAAGFGDMFSQIGFTGDQAAKMSKDVVQLSADLGSFNNLETADVAERMSAAFRGEFDSLQALVPNINAARVETQALAMTGKKAAEELTAQEKAAATLAIVTKDGARAQGDFARTSDGLANQTKILKAQLDNASASFGQKLLPMAVELAQYANDDLVPALEKGADWIGARLPGAIDTAVDAGRDLRDALAPAAEEIAEALANLSGEGGGAGRMFNNVFIPAVRTTAEILGGLVDFVDDLPGPVKTMGAEVAVAAFAFSKLSGAVQGMALTNFITDVQTAETRTRALHSAARTAAGAGGLLLLAKGFGDAKSEGNKFTGVLEGMAGGAALGFAAGGPFGALIGAAGGGGLMALTAAFSDTESEARAARLELKRSQGFAEAAADADKLTSALQGVVNEYGNVSIAAVKASFVDPDTGNLEDDVQLLRDMGISMDTIASATLGQKNALDIVRGALAGYGDDLDANLSAAKDHLLELMEQSADYAQQPGIEPVSPEELADASQAVEDAKEAVDDFNATQEIFGERVNENTDAVQAHKEKVRELADALNVSARIYQKWPAKARTEIEADGLPETSEGALRLIRQYRGLQKFDRIKAVVSAPGVDLTRKQVLALQRRYDLTPRQVRTLMRQEGIPTSLRGLSQLLARQKVVPKHIRTLIEAANLPFTVKQVQGFQRDLDKTDKKRPKPKVDLEAREWVRGYETINRGMATLDKKHSKPKASIDRAPIAGDIAWINGSMDRIPDETVIVWVERRERGGGGDGATESSGVESGRFEAGSSTEFGRTLAAASREAARQGRAFRGIGAGIVKSLLRGLNSGDPREAERAVNRMMDAISKAVKDDKITKAAAARMRETVNAMAREAGKLQGALQKRLEFASSLKESFKDELDFGSILDSEGFSGISSITGATQSLATRLNAFAVQLKELRADGMPKALIGEIASLGTVKGSEVAAAILGGTHADQQLLANAFVDYQRAAGLTADVAANTVHGTVKEIKQEFKVTINVQGGESNRETGREIEQALIRWSRQVNRPLQIPVA